MSAKIAETMFSGGPRDELLTVDVYQLKDNTIRTKVADMLNSSRNNLISTLQSSINTPNILTKLVTVDGGKISFNKKELLDRLSTIAPGLKGSLREMGDGLQAKVLDSFGVDGFHVNQLKMLVNGGFSDIDISELGNAKDIAEIMTTVAGTDAIVKLFDVEAEAALFGTILRESIRLGVPDLIDLVKEQSSSPVVFERVQLQSIETALQTGNLTTLEAIYRDLGPGKMLARVPRFATLLLQNYRFGRNNRSSDYATLSSRLVELADNVQPGWNETLRHGTPVINLEPYSKASRDATTLLMLSEDHRITTMVAKQYPPRSLVSIAKTMYPKSAI